MARINLLTCLALVFLLGLAGAGTCFAETSCAVCHNAMSGSAQLDSGETIQLGVSMDRFKKSVHGFLECTDCHMRFNENPHVTPDNQIPEAVNKLSGEIAAKPTSDPVASSACLTCHEDIVTKVLGSVHGKNIAEKGKTDGAWCLDCHGSPHYIVSSTEKDSPVNRTQVVDTCGNCHGSETMQEEYKLETDVMPSYQESFHGKKYHLGHTKVPTCVSCHGAHDIRSGSDPASPVVGTVNKMKTCGHCHKGANAKFVASITHKPVGSIPHYAEKGLIILLISTITFTIVHVILEAYSDVRDTLFRKGGKEENDSIKECA